MTRLEALKDALQQALGEQRIKQIADAIGEITVDVRAADWVDIARTLRDTPALRFEMLIDLCGVDYSNYGEGSWDGARFAVVLHLLSLEHNQRVRVRAFCPDDDYPLMPSLMDVWPNANWYEREAFDLFGIMFEGHLDLRRILTDYGFIGHPFRKDFPITGYVEMRYDPEQRRVIYQPITIEQRETTPRVIREESFGRGR